MMIPPPSKQRRVLEGDEQHIDAVGSSCAVMEKQQLREDWPTIYIDTASYCQQTYDRMNSKSSTISSSSSQPSSVNNKIEPPTQSLISRNNTSDANVLGWVCKNIFDACSLPTSTTTDSKKNNKGWVGGNFW